MYIPRIYRKPWGPLALLIFGGAVMCFGKFMPTTILANCAYFSGLCLMVAGTIGKAFPLLFPGIYTKEFWEKRGGNS